MAREQDIFHLPYQILEDGPDLLLALNRNFKEVERMLSQLQMYEKQVGKPVNQIVVEGHEGWVSSEELGDMAYENLVELAKLGNTVIEGGYLKTELIKVSDIFATNATIEATLTMGTNGLIVVNNNTVIDNQGILQTWQDSHADNVDSTHKLMLKVYIPPETQQIRKITLSFTRENFRAYSKGVPSGGGHTTASGGGSTSGSSSKSTADADGNHRHIMFVADETGSYSTERKLGCYTDAAGSNTASISAGVSSGVSQYTTLYTSGSSGTHSHGMNHTHSTPNHTHAVSDHTHDIDYGIYTSTSATNNEVYINGTKRLPASGTYTSNQQDLDLSPWITTTGWHTIEISSGQLGRINAVAFVQVFLGLS